MRGVGNLSGLTKEEMFSDVANIESLADKLEVAGSVFSGSSSFDANLTFFLLSLLHISVFGMT